MVLLSLVLVRKIGIVKMGTGGTTVVEDDMELLYLFVFESLDPAPKWEG